VQTPFVTTPSVRSRSPVFPKIHHSPHFRALASAGVAPYRQIWARFSVLQQSKIRDLCCVSPNSTAVCPIFEASPTFQPGYNPSCGVSTLATQDIDVLYLTHPTWGTSFTTASNLQRSKTPGSGSTEVGSTSPAEAPQAHLQIPWKRLGSPATCVSKSAVTAEPHKPGKTFESSNRSRRRTTP
jgi:hypothetical protein